MQQVYFLFRVIHFVASLSDSPFGIFFARRRRWLAADHLQHGSPVFIEYRSAMARGGALRGGFERTAYQQDCWRVHLRRRAEFGKRGAPLALLRRGGARDDYRWSRGRESCVEKFG